jgi:hypothetical protein
MGKRFENSFSARLRLIKATRGQRRSYSLSSAAKQSENNERRVCGELTYAGRVPLGMSFRRTTSQARPTFSISQIM